MLERCFGLARAGATVGSEVRGGLTTFMVMGEGLIGVRVELAAGQAHDVRGIEARVLGVDGDEELDGLPCVEPVEEHSGDFDTQVLASLGQGMESEEPVLTVQHAQHPMLFRDL